MAVAHQRSYRAVFTTSPEEIKLEHSSMADDVYNIKLVSAININKPEQRIYGTYSDVMAELQKRNRILVMEMEDGHIVIDFRTVILFINPARGCVVKCLAGFVFDSKNKMYYLGELIRSTCTVEKNHKEAKLGPFSTFQTDSSLVRSLVVNAGRIGCVYAKKWPSTREEGDFACFFKQFENFDLQQGKIGELGLSIAYVSEHTTKNVIQLNVRKAVAFCRKNPIPGKTVPMYAIPNTKVLQVKSFKLFDRENKDAAALSSCFNGLVKKIVDNFTQIACSNITDVLNTVMVCAKKTKTKLEEAVEKKRSTPEAQLAAVSTEIAKTTQLLVELNKKRDLLEKWVDVDTTGLEPSIQNAYIHLTSTPYIEAVGNKLTHVLVQSYLDYFEGKKVCGPEMSGNCECYKNTDLIPLVRYTDYTGTLLLYTKEMVASVLIKLAADFKMTQDTDYDEKTFENIAKEQAAYFVQLESVADKLKPDRICHGCNCGESCPKTIPPYSRIKQLVYRNIAKYENGEGVFTEKAKKDMQLRVTKMTVAKFSVFLLSKAFKAMFSSQGENKRRIFAELKDQAVVHRLDIDMAINGIHSCLPLYFHEQALTDDITTTIENYEKRHVPKEEMSQLLNTIQKFLVYECNNLIFTVFDNSTWGKLWDHPLKGFYFFTNNLRSEIINRALVLSDRGGEKGETSSLSDSGEPVRENEGAGAIPTVEAVNRHPLYYFYNALKNIVCDDKQHTKTEVHKLIQSVFNFGNPILRKTALKHLEYFSKNTSYRNYPIFHKLPWLIYDGAEAVADSTIRTEYVKWITSTDYIVALQKRVSRERSRNQESIAAVEKQRDGLTVTALSAHPVSSGGLEVEKKAENLLSQLSLRIEKAEIQGGPKSAVVQ